MPFFSKVFKSKDGAPSTSKRNVHDANVSHAPPPKPRFASSWDSNEVIIEEVEELVHACTVELKSRAEALDTPFLLLPFRPEGDINSARTFIRNFFKGNKEGSYEYRGEALQRELRLTEPDVLCCIIKWLWSRIPDGVVSWNVYASFRAGEQESGMVVNSFDSFIPISVDSEGRKNIIYDFFDLLSVVAAHGKVNGMGGRKLSRMAGWWAFEQSDTGKGFVGGYKSWADAADATSHLFFAYLRSRAPDAVKGIAGISNLPRALQALVAQTEYPPQRPALLQTSTAKVLMIVDAVSPTPFALLRRARLFDYRADDKALNRFAEYADPVDALTEECKRVLEAISSINQSSAARSRRGNISSARLPSNFSLTSGDDSWSRFQDEGFSSAPVDSAAQSPQPQSPISKRDSPPFTYANLQARQQSRLAVGGRPTTPSWADFLNSGFVEEGKSGGPGLLLRPDQQLPPVVDRNSMTGSLDDEDLEPGELASINRFELDESFWWVWMTSLAGEETSVRKATFGRCALVETSISGGRWLLLEEQVKGAAQSPPEGAYIAEKKSRFGFSRRNRSTKKKNSKRSEEPETPRLGTEATPIGSAKANVSPDQKAKISAAAAAIARQQKNITGPNSASRRGRFDDAASTKTSSMLTVGFTQEASPALNWARAYDKEAVRKQYLGDNFAGKGLSREISESTAPSTFGEKENQDPRKISEEAQKPADLSKPLPSPLLANPQPAEPLRSSAPPSPKPPVANVETTDETLAVAAAQVPLPPASPGPQEPSGLEKSPSEPVMQSNVGRKHLTAEQAQHVHPAFRGPGISEPVSKTQATMTSTADEPDKTGPGVKKLQKKPQGSTGLKKMFGKKKDDPKRMSTEVTGMSAPRDPAESVVNEGPIRSKAAPPVAAEKSRIPQRSAVRDMAQKFETVNKVPPPSKRAVPAETPKEAPVSPVSPLEAAPVKEEFSRFDQGPLDVPAFVPRGSFDEESIQSPAVSTFQDRGIEGNTMRTPQFQAPTAFAKSQQALVTSDSVSEVSGQDESAQFSHSDRWAQIRKNAAERAARASEEQSMRSQGQSTFTDRTDDGETSGEETIEERVARIKARVAQLTGNTERS
ncbi:hypothetical protein K461DRAFT_290008 [Myriangium duriaei CBS 260.36]|uniref:Meiotically up-regulated protein Msb1/Mug8 domain-containing protein n=1 Tax=Myriangium duriaei CBS 260.36 TaxID=1168546 RepID=A0A9P4J9C2_9PEZI|nr:hypothetical protein K461DRAFT_290008 [Myriangium duriaei CBS 260.36]